MQHPTHARRPGLTAPEPPANETGLVARYSDQTRDEQQISDTLNSAAVEAKRKAFATLAARLALVGLQLHRLDDDTLLVTRTGLIRRFQGEAAVEQFLEQVGKQ